ncbi:ATP-binding protein [Bacillus wiedmannii]|uniref:AAA family ATPase n=1 Tax=Bacillus wiedmannii TaxID=1890302 RepID=UPI000BF4E06A|nr:ATP-binding protein [Bacillus wiedmannii]PEP94379.1 ATP-binding protein [Bacillus wiedmannii]PFY72367.1 ATP-binding protein [Bacillus wiedmannii]PHF06325.1 ATP-binding protein [Bacillus wiedmannii]
MFLLQMSGFPGSGKSTVSKYIAKLTGAVIVDHDVLKSALIDSYLEQGHSVILDSPCLYEGMVEKGIKLSNKHGVKYKYIECYLNDMEEINHRLQTRKRMVSQIGKVDSEVALKKWLDGSKRPSNTEYLIVDSDKPLERYAQKMMDYMSR